MKRVYVDPTSHLGRASRGDFAGPSWHDMALAALRLRREGPRGELLALEALPPAAAPSEHQMAGALAILERMGSRALLADEESLDPVGTAALVVREWAVRYGSPSLVLTPASRVAVWRRALAGWKGHLAPTLALHGQAEPGSLEGWENVVIDGAHAAIDDPGLRCAGRRRLLVTSTPVRTGMHDLIPLLGMLGATPDPAGLRRQAIRRLAPPVVQTRLAEIVHLDASPEERALVGQARELASAAIPHGGAVAAVWRELLAAASLPQTVQSVSVRALAVTLDGLGRARILSLLGAAQACLAGSSSKFEALVPLVAGAAHRTLICLASEEGATWIRQALGARGFDVGPRGQVWAVADDDSRALDPSAFERVVHLDVPWDPRILAERLERARGARELRSFHLALAGSVEEEILTAFQDSLALAAPLGLVAGAIAEAPDDPAVAAGAAIVVGEGAFSRWAHTLAVSLECARQAALATSRVLGDLELGA